MSECESKAVERCIRRVKILIEGVKQLTDEKYDAPDMVRGQCRCGAVTRFGVCANCTMERLRQQQGL